MLIVIYVHMPKRVCYNEYKVTRIELNCYGYIIPANAERICDEGSEGEAAVNNLNYGNIVWDCKPDGIQRFCMYKEKKEVCDWSLK